MDLKPTPAKAEARWLVEFLRRRRALGETTASILELIRVQPRQAEFLNERMPDAAPFYVQYRREVEREFLRLIALTKIV